MTARYILYIMAAILFLVTEGFGLWAKPKKRRKRKSSTSGSKSTSKRRSTGGKGRSPMSNMKRMNAINSKIVRGVPLNDNDKKFKQAHPNFKWKKR